MKKYFSAMRLKTRFLLLVFIIILVVLGIPGVTLYISYYKRLSPLITQSYEMSINNKAGNIKTIVQNIDRTVEGINHNEIAMLSAGNSNFTPVINAIVHFQSLRQTSDVKGEVEKFNKASEYFDNLVRFSCSQFEKGCNAQLIVFDEYPIADYLSEWNAILINTNKIVSGKLCAEASWYQETKKRNGAYYWFVLPEYPKQIFVSKLLTYRQVEKEFKTLKQDIGIVVFSLDKYLIEKNLSCKDEPYHISSYVTYEGQKLIEYGEPTISLADNGLKEMYDDIHDDDSRRVNYNNGEYFIRKTEIGQGLELYTWLPVRDVLVMDAKVLIVFLGILFFIFIVLWFSIKMLRDHFVRPLLVFSEKIRDGVIDEKKESLLNDRQDEIGSLYREYQKMQDKNMELIQDIWRESEKRRQKEIIALQMQINPHFVFNTLGSISCCALMRGEDDIAKQLSVLSTIMRYYTRNPDKIVPLREELAMIEQYEILQQMTHDKKLKFKHSIDPECEDFMIPKLIVQPLVENAILHGGSIEEDIHEIDISAILFQKKELIIVIRDSGKNADTDWINRYLAGECEKEGTGGSFGIRNVRERINLIFGNHGILVYKKDENDRTMAIVRITEV